MIKNSRHRHAAKDTSLLGGADHAAAGEEPTIVVGHSYGGIVIAETAAPEGAVRHPVRLELPGAGRSDRTSEDREHTET